MNNKRRSEIKAIALQLEELRDKVEDLQREEQDAFDAMPESLQGGDRGDTSQAAADMLGEAYSSIDEAINQLGEAAGEE